ncbi:Detected protein of confused Function [Hibiscus syriacus]|uniref:Detected protein of confused Function n=1 Tax=Hibiscus syriacus TaxID=106335 RepID=A0A6A2XMN7_HIBSY|nr:Detected protein of confused Function [Hibiscus syriacus]
MPFLHLYMLSFLFLLLPPSTISIPERELESLLLLKKHFTNAGALRSWMPCSVPCNGRTHWTGLLCYNGIVVDLNLKGMGLSGNIKVDALAEIKGLRSFSVVNNSFQGDIPELNRLVELRALYLSGNQFSGEIPPYYFSEMVSLKKVWLSDNKFTGSIPLSLGQLPHLVELRIENNQFSGHIPAFYRPNLNCSLSNNKLMGDIPFRLSKFNES